MPPRKPPGHIATPPVVSDDDTFDTSPAAQVKAAVESLKDDKRRTGPGGNHFAKDQLRSVVERVERLEEEKAALAADIKEVYAEAKGNGFDVKILRKVIRIRKQDAAKRAEEEEMTDLYLSAVGSGR